MPPRLDPSAFDVPRAYTVTLRGALENPTVAGFARSGGSLAVRGDLRLEGGVLFVKGDLSVEGGIRGRGAVFVEGKTRIGGGSNLSTDDVAAVVSGGDLTLESSGDRGRHVFQGLVYTRGRLTARNVTVLGAMVSTAPMTVDNSTIVSVPMDKLMIVGDSISEVDDMDGSDDPGDGSGLEFNAVAFYDRAARGWRYDVRASLVINNAAQQTFLQKGLTRKAAVRFLAGIHDMAPTGEVPDTPRFDAYLDGLIRQAMLRGVVMDADLNRFLQPADRMRILLWRPL